MIVVIPFHQGDMDQADRMLCWIAELGKVNATCLLAYDKSAFESGWWSVHQAAEEAFKHVENQKIDVGSFPRERENSWRPAANQMFKCVAGAMAERLDPEPFLWLEPDCVPLKNGWFNVIEEEYNDCGKAFMGTMVEVPRMGKPFRFMCGVAVYPAHARDIMAGALDGNEPWDTAAERHLDGMVYDSKRIQHAYHKPATMFVGVKKPGSKDNVQDVSFLRPEAMIYHRVKDDSLIALLRRWMYAR